MDWQGHYRQNLVTADEAVQHIQAGCRLVFAIGRQPWALGFALAGRATELRGTELIVPSADFDFGWYDEGWEDFFDVRTSYVFPKGVAREWMDAKRGDYLVQTIVPFVTGREHADRIDVLLVEISPPDAHGYCSFGASLWNKKEQVRQAKVVIAEVNARLIRTYGENYVHVSEIDYFVEQERTAGRGVRPPVPGPHAQSIADEVARLVRDGDTIQVGAGSSSETIIQLGAFDNRVDLGQHSEMTARGIVKLVREGVINGRRKTLHRDVAVATAVGGSAEDMAYIHNNPQFEVYSSSYVNNPLVIAKHDNMFAVNNALMVDLTGEITAEAIGPRMISGSGGQLAFAVGARYSKGGRSITVLPATASGGNLSRIVPQLPEGTVVTIPREFADYVITEYGTAHLRGKTARQRADALIGIAHPDFRSELRTMAARLLKLRC